MCRIREIRNSDLGAFGVSLTAQQSCACALPSHAPPSVCLSLSLSLSLYS
jgi:hypothetical protein